MFLSKTTKNNNILLCKGNLYIFAYYINVDLCLIYSNAEHTFQL